MPGVRSSGVIINSCELLSMFDSTNSSQKDALVWSHLPFELPLMNRNVTVEMVLKKTLMIVFLKYYHQSCDFNKKTKKCNDVLSRKYVFLF